MRGLLVVSVLVAATGVSQSALGGYLDFTMYNDTNQPIVRLWTSPTTSPDWIEATDIYIPRGGKGQRITFPSQVYGSDCYQDLKFQFQGGTVRTIEHVYLCGITAITIDVDSDGTITYAATKP
jgi:hypothetical protein